MSEICLENVLTNTNLFLAWDKVRENAGCAGIDGQSLDDFECRLNGDALDSLRLQVADYIEKDDSVRWYPLCAWCESEVDRQGCGNPVDHSEFYLL
jgi:hypothetical protein